MSKKENNKKIEPEPIAIIIVLLTTLGIGTFFYNRVEGFSWIDSLYFSVITLTTVGYGDLSPETNAGKLFTVGYVLFGIGIVAFSANYLLKKVAQNRRR